jgi:hypothetical protein
MTLARARQFANLVRSIERMQESLKELPRTPEQRLRVNGICTVLDEMARRIEAMRDEDNDA